MKTFKRSIILLFFFIFLFIGGTALSINTDKSPTAPTPSTATDTAASSEKTAGKAPALKSNAPSGYVSIMGSRKAVTESDKKILKIEEIIHNYADSGENINSKDVKQQILDNVSSIYPFDKRKEVSVINSEKIAMDAAKSAIEKYPMSEKQLQVQLERDADDKFKLTKYDDIVNVVFVQGPFRKSISGNFHGITQGQDGVKIDDYIIPIYDLCDTDKARFDSNYMNKKKKEFISSQTEEYFKNKDIYRMVLIKDMTESLTKANEDAGYIFAWQKWRNPENVVDILIKWISDKIKETKQKSAEKSVAVQKGNEKVKE